MANIIRIKDLQEEYNLDGNESIPIDKDEYGANARRINLSHFNQYITGMTWNYVSGFTSGTDGAPGAAGTGSTVENFWFEEQDGSINLDLDTGTWITHIYFTGTTTGKTWISPLENGNILVYSAVTVNDGFWYPTGSTFGMGGTSGSSGTNGTSGSSGINGTNGTSGSSGSSGTNGTSGSSGSSGTNGTSGSSGTNGTSGSSGISGVSEQGFPFYVVVSGETYVTSPQSINSGGTIVFNQINGISISTGLTIQGFLELNLSASQGLDEWVVISVPELDAAWNESMNSDRFGRIWCVGSGFTWTQNSSYIIMPSGNTNAHKIEISGLPEATFNVSTFTVRFGDGFLSNIIWRTNTTNYITSYNGRLKLKNNIFIDDQRSGGTDRIHINIDGYVRDNTGLIDIDGIMHYTQNYTWNNTDIIQPIRIHNTENTPFAFDNLYVNIRGVDTVSSFERFNRVRLSASVSTDFKVSGDETWYFVPEQDLPGINNIDSTSEIFKTSSVDRVRGERIPSGSTSLTKYVMLDTDNYFKIVTLTGVTGGGTSGSSGTNGTSGSSGTNGISGTNGTSGSSGTNGTSGSSGISPSLFAWVIDTPEVGGVPGPRIAHNMNITRIDSYITTETGVTFNIEDRSTIGVTGTNLGSDQITNISGVSSGVTYVISADNWLWLNIKNISGTPDKLVVSIKANYT